MGLASGRVLTHCGTRASAFAVCPLLLLRPPGCPSLPSPKEEDGWVGPTHPSSKQHLEEPTQDALLRWAHTPRGRRRSVALVSIQLPAMAAV